MSLEQQKITVSIYGKEESDLTHTGLTFSSLESRILEAEKIHLRSLPPEPNIKWLKTICTNCGAKVEYSPKDRFDGKLYCGTCGKKFRLTRLDDFMGVET